MGDNVGENKDSGKRQRAAIQAFAKRAGYEMIQEFNDEAVKALTPSMRARALRP